MISVLFKKNIGKQIISKKVIALELDGRWGKSLNVKQTTQREQQGAV